MPDGNQPEFKKPKALEATAIKKMVKAYRDRNAANLDLIGAIVDCASMYPQHYLKARKAIRAVIDGDENVLHALSDQFFRDESIDPTTMSGGDT